MFRVLVAEDNPVSRAVARLVLEGQGCRVKLVEDGHLAVQEHQSDPYDLILLDLQLPTMDGLEAARQIREWEARQNLEPVPIAALTARTREEDRRASEVSGMTHFLSKPIKAEELKELLVQLRSSVL